MHLDTNKQRVGFLRNLGPSTVIWTRPQTTDSPDQSQDVVQWPLRELE